MARPKSNRQRNRFSISLDAGEYQQIRQIAELNDVSTAWIVRRAVSKYLEDQHLSQSAKADAASATFTVGVA